MAHFVLIHGAWHGGWCWEEVVPLLEAEGHTADAPDLPGHGDDPGDPADATLELYADRVAEAVEAAPGRAILVGHSMGGMPISQAAERLPERVAALVYVAAFLPRDGESLLAIEGRNPRPTVPPAAVPSADERTLTIPKEKHRELFYAQVPPGTMARAQSRLTPQATAALLGEVRLTPERFGAIPRHYVACTEDGAVSYELQRMMIERDPMVRVHALPSDHSPFFSDPGGLAAILHEVARG